MKKIFILLLLICLTGCESRQEEAERYYKIKFNGFYSVPIVLRVGKIKKIEYILTKADYWSEESPFISLIVFSDGVIFSGLSKHPFGSYFSLPYSPKYINKKMVLYKRINLNRWENLNLSTVDDFKKEFGEEYLPKKEKDS